MEVIGFSVLPRYSGEGILPAKMARNRHALIHSDVVVAIAAPFGPIPSIIISKMSRSKLITLAKNNTKIGVFVSRYPRNTPVEASIHSTAGAANARIVKKSIA